MMKTTMTKACLILEHLIYFFATLYNKIFILDDEDADDDEDDGK